MARLLSEAINYRDKEEATKCLQQLLDLKLPVCVKLRPEAYHQEAIRYAVKPVVVRMPTSFFVSMSCCDALIGCRLRVGVADTMSDVCIPITVMVPVYMTISELKEKVNDALGIAFLYS